MLLRGKVDNPLRRLIFNAAKGITCSAEDAESVLLCRGLDFMRQWPVGLSEVSVNPVRYFMLSRVLRLSFLLHESICVLSLESKL